MGIEQGVPSGEHAEASPAMEVAPSSGPIGDAATVNQRVVGGADLSPATAAAIGHTASAGEVGLVQVVGSDDVGLPAATDLTVDAADTDAGADTPVAYPSEQAAARVDYWHPQGNQYRNYEGTCGLAASAGMMSEQSGRAVSEAEVTRHAAEHGLCTTEADTLNPRRLGGTTPQSLAVVHTDFGLDSREEPRQNQADLATAVERGDGVIAAVNCADYWPDDAFESPQSREAHRTSEQHNHAVWVTGVSRSPEGEITGFYVNDTGLDDGAGKFVGANDWARAWQARGGVMVTARRTQ